MFLNKEKYLFKDIMLLYITDSGVICLKLNILDYDLPIYTKNKYFKKEQQIFFDFHYKFIYN